MMLRSTVSLLIATLLCTAAAAAASEADNNGCDTNKGWTLRSSRCFRVFDAVQPVKWQEAASMCHSSESDLATATDASKNSDIKELLKSKSGSSGSSSSWIGLKSFASASDPGHEWRWVDNSQLQFESWQSGTRPPVAKGQENNVCVLADNNNGMWRGTACDAANERFVCERSPGSCAAGWIRHRDACYAFRLQRVSWDEANAACRSMGAELIHLQRQHIQVFVNKYKEDFIKARIPHIWIGIHKPKDANSHTDLQWQNGNKVSDGYSNWAVGEPRMVTGRDRAARIISESDTGSWEMADAVSTGGFACQLPVGRDPIVPTTPNPLHTCQPGWRLFRRSCYRLRESASSWSVAQSQCRSLHPGASLVDIRDAGEQEFVQRLLLSSNCWIGLRAQTGPPRVWVWSFDNSRVTFTNWAKGEPNDYAGAEDCGEMNLEGKWNDLHCDARLPSICKMAAEFDPSRPTQTPQVSTTRVWDPQCGQGWTRDPLTDKCYMIVEEAMTWLAAKQNCEKGGGKLTSIVTDTEKTYIVGRLQSVRMRNPSISAFWIGLNERAENEKWVWDDSQPVTYVNWGSGEPADDWISNCAALVAATATWRAADCSKSYASVCKKVRDGATTVQPQVTTIEVPDGLVRGCPAEYSGYASMCYRVWSSSATWQQAKVTCRREGGDLASVMSMAEQEFIYELATKTIGEKNAWIGFYDSIASHRTMYFKWSDTSQPTFTNWHRGEPNNYQFEEDCVEMKADWYGEWNDLSCERQLPFVCKRRQVPVTPAPTTPPTVPGCRADYDDAFDGFCLKIVVPPRSLNAGSASNECRSIGGTLATIASRQMQQHVWMRIAALDTRTNFWIGATVRRRQTRWDDGSPVTYTNWDGHHGIRSGRAQIDISLRGRWSRQSSSRLANYVCSAKQQEVTQPPSTTNAATCADGWVEAEGVCYKAFSVLPITVRKSWTEARAHCHSQGGDLASIHSNATVEALKATVVGLNEYWIGLNSRDANQDYLWADGSPVSYVRWQGDDPPENINGNQNCVFLSARNMFWFLNNCNVAKNWLCQVPKGVQPTGTMPPATDDPDVPDCGDGWQYHNGSCYSFSSSLDTWHGALRSCRDEAADLTSIHSLEESDFLLRAVSRLHLSLASYWIGLNEIGHTDGFSWSDGSPLNFINWNKGEPNDYEGAEHCGSLYSRTGLWNDEQCGLRLRFICKRNNNTGTAAPTSPITGRCPEGFTKVGVKCFRVFAEPKVTWKEANERCMGIVDDRRSFLASVSNDFEQSALIAMRSPLEKPLWIGLYTRDYTHNYYWIDNSEVTYTNWDHNEPSSILGKCVEMHTDRYRAGRWNDVNCARTLGFVCMSYVDDRLSTEWQRSTAAPCPAGWHEYSDACYTFVSSSDTWTEAEAACSSQSGASSLASVQNVWQQSFMHSLLRSSDSAWIGLHRRGGNSSFEWSNGWPVAFTNWGDGQPDSSSGGCVRIDANGRWFVDNCERRMSRLCRLSRSQPPSLPPPPPPGKCPSDQFVQFGTSCFLVNSAGGLVSAHRAQFLCRGLGAVLASISTVEEQHFLATRIRSVYRNESSRPDFWIGLIRSRRSGFEWYDETPVSFTYWSQGEPSNTDNEDCVEMYHASLKWNDHYCSKRNSFICKAPLVPATETTQMSTLAPTTTTRLITSASTSRSTSTSSSTSISSSSSSTVSTSTSSAGASRSSLLSMNYLRNDGLVAGLLSLFVILLLCLAAVAVLYRCLLAPRTSEQTAAAGFGNANWSKESGSVQLQNPSQVGLQVQLDAGIENPSFGAQQ